MALKEKAQVVRRSNVLEYRTSAKTLDAVGGLENIKTWVQSHDALFSQAEAARSYGLKAASGLLLVGIPGCGKSLTAECLAGHWKLPLLMLDVGKLFGSLVGQSEQNVDQMIGLAKACAPCVIFLDELDKGLGGSTGELDGGTSTRVKGKLLTWLQEKPDDVFVVATANDVKKFEQSPELIRAGRFDCTFFCDLPDLRTRIEILSIHLRAAGHNIPADDLVSAAKASRGYSGAELEVAVQNALRLAFNLEPRPLHPTAEMLVEGIKKQKPLSETMKESVKRLRDWCKEGRAFPAGTTLEDDEASDGASLKDRGLPIVSAD
jgi:SpoVK/Ycf46/Vps4 family AAA+-type ATPase